MNCVHKESPFMGPISSSLKSAIKPGRPSKTRFKVVLMGGPLYSEGTGLLLAGAAVFVVGFFVFCCIDHCWLRRDLRKADRWSIFPSSSSNSNSASDSMYSP